MKQIEREYLYRPKWTMIVFGALFFGLGGVFFTMQATTNDRGLILYHVVELGPDGASAFFGGFAVLSFGFVAMLGVVAYHRLRFNQRLAFGPTAITLPASRWSRAEIDIAYRDILSLTEIVFNGQRFLDVMHLGGKTTITASMLPSKTAYTEFCELLAVKVRQAQA